LPTDRYAARRIAHLEGFEGIVPYTFREYPHPAPIASEARPQKSRFLVDALQPNSDTDQLPPWAYRKQDLKAVANDAYGCPSRIVRTQPFRYLFLGIPSRITSLFF
jgi:hypothetical protein